MSSSIAIFLVVALILAGIFLGRVARKSPATTRLRLALSIAALIIALWSLWSTVQDHRGPDPRTVGPPSSGLVEPHYLPSTPIALAR